MENKAFRKLKEETTSLKIKCMYANRLIKLTDKQLNSLFEKRK